MDATPGTFHGLFFFNQGVQRHGSGELGATSLLALPV
jgi:hypothetical protein